MELEKQVCCLELAKRLKELGVKQQSLFYWKHLTDSPDGKIDRWVLEDDAPNYDTPNFISAFTVAELGEMLPGDLLIGDTHYQQFTDRFHDKWLVGYPTIREDDINFSETEADARAAALIHLLENKLITAE